MLLAHLPADVLAGRVLDWRPVRLTPRTITQRAALLAELQRVAEQGWAQNLEESAVGAASVAAPVRAEDGEVLAAISVVGPVSRSHRVLPRHRAAVIEAADLISTRIGYRSPGTR